MIHKWSGKKIVKVGYCIALFALAIGGCDSDIPGHPKKVAREYINAIQSANFQTIIKLNFDTARSRKYLGCSGKEAEGNICKENFTENKTSYQNAEPSFSPGVRWAEKHYFPSSALVNIGEPYPPVAAGKDDVNARYEMAVSVFVPVKVEYPEQKDAPAQNGRKIKAASFECVLRKIREGGNVRVYSSDTKWYFAGCVFNPSSAKYR